MSDETKGQPHDAAYYGNDPLTTTNSVTGSPATSFKVVGIDLDAVRKLANETATALFEKHEAVRAARTEYRKKNGPPFGKHVFG